MRPRTIAALSFVLLIAAAPKLRAATPFDYSTFSDLLKGVLANMASPPVGATPGVVEVVGMSAVDAELTKALDQRLNALKLTTRISNLQNAPPATYEEFLDARLASAGRVVCIVAVDLTPDMLYIVSSVARKKGMLTVSPYSDDVNPISFGMNRVAGLLNYSKYTIAKEHVTFKDPVIPGARAVEPKVDWSQFRGRIDVMKDFLDAVKTIESSRQREELKKRIRQIERLLPVQDTEQRVEGSTTLPWPKEDKDYLPHYALAYAFAKLKNEEAACLARHLSNVAQLNKKRLDLLDKEMSSANCNLTAWMPLRVALLQWR
jgi:hypothetical protein